MHPMLSTLPTLLVTTLYYFWRVYNKERKHRLGTLRQRVTYMLWVMAQRVAANRSSAVQIHAPPLPGRPCVRRPHPLYLAASS